MPQAHAFLSFKPTDFDVLPSNSFTNEGQLSLAMTSLELSFKSIPSKSIFSIKGWAEELPVHNISLARVRRVLSRSSGLPYPTYLPHQQFSCAGS